MADHVQLMELARREVAAGDDPVALAAIEDDYERICDTTPDFLLQRNHFRVCHASAMRHRKPRLLYGRDRCAAGNFHTAPLLECADVVFLSLYGEPTTASDHLSLVPSEQTIDDIVARLPAGFMPDLYFDYQVCMATVHPRGMEMAPFPTFGSLCHHFYALRCEALTRLFDFVLPLSSPFARLMGQAVDPAKLINLPFGLSWGSFDHVLYGDPNAPRDIDVLLSFGDLSFKSGSLRNSGDLINAAYGPYRRRCVALFEQAKAKLGDRYNFVFATGLPQREYHDLIRRSRISLNAVGVHGPYNYRTCEMLNLGTVLMQYEPSFVTGPQGMADYLTPGESYVPFDDRDFLPKLEALLADDVRARAIARHGQEEMKRRYDLRRLYREFLDIALAIPRQAWLSRRPSAAQAALDRVNAYLRDNRRVVWASANNDAVSALETQALAALDLGDAVAVSGIHPAAFLMPLYKALRPSLQPGVLEGIVGPGALDLRQDALEFYDRALAAIPDPPVVDRFNHLVLSAEEGRIVVADVLALMDILESSPPRLDHDDIVRIVSAIPRENDTALAQQGDVAIRNIGDLMAGGDAARRSAVAIDFMRFWLCLLLAKTDEAKAILAGYPLVEETVPAGAQTALLNVA